MSKDKIYQTLPACCPNCGKRWYFLKLARKHKTYECMNCQFRLKQYEDGYRELTE